MKAPSWRRWWPVALYLGLCATFMVLGFAPFHRRAQEQSRRAAQLAQELDAKIAVIESLPQQQTDLKRLTAELARFRSSLAGTHEVDRVMERLRARAEESGLELWILNPSVPVLIKLEAGGDSLSRLDLVVLPVVFECRGPFGEVARFLESEEGRPDFYRWVKLAMTTDPLARGVQAKAEVQLFLLPTDLAEEASS